MVLIPWQELSEEALTGLIDAFVLREGTDYGAASEIPSLAQKRQAVMRQLQAETAVIVYHSDTQSIDIRLTDQLPAG